MDRRIPFLILGIFAIGLVWVLYSMVQDASAHGRVRELLAMWVLLILVGFLLFFATGLAFVGIDILRLQVPKWRFRLLTGTSMEEVLEEALRESPYALVPGGQGEPYYVIDTRTSERVDWQDPDGAEAWLFRQYVRNRWKVDPSLLCGRSLRWMRRLYPRPQPTKQHQEAQR